MKYMKIVARTANGVYVQTSDDKREWSQIELTTEQFREAMRKYFTKYYYRFRMHELHMGEYAQDVCTYFYHYGETEEMIRSGEAYIFIAQVR